VPFTITPSLFRKNVERVEGIWTAQTSGGCPSDRGYLENPQQIVDIQGDDETELIITLETLSKFAVHARLYRLSTKKRLNSIQTIDFVFSSGTHRYGSTGLHAKCLPGRYVVIVSQSEADQIGPYRLSVECDASFRSSLAPTRSSGRFRLVRPGQWNEQSAKGNPRLGEYDLNPRLHFQTDSSTTIDLYLYLSPPGALSSLPSSVYYHLALFKSDTRGGLGEQVASSPSYSHTAQGISLEGIHLPSSNSGYIIVPSTYTPYLGNFIITIYSDRKCAWRDE